MCLCVRDPVRILYVFVRACDTVRILCVCVCVFSRVKVTVEGIIDDRSEMCCNFLRLDTNNNCRR